MSVMTLDEIQQAQQANQNTGRESYHWHTIPEAYRGIPGIQQWANDPNVDPNALVQQYLNAQRAAAPAGTPGAADQGDAALLLRNFGQQSSPAAAPSGGAFSGGSSLGSAYAPYTNVPTPTPYQPFQETFQAPSGTMDAWGQTFTPPSRPSDLATPYGQTFTAPTRPSDLDDPWGQTFTAPTRPDDLDDKWDQTFKFDASDLQNDPGYQFLREQGTVARERAAAARGTLNNPGLAQELEEFGQGLASTHLGEAFNRQLSSYGTNYDTFTGDRARRSAEANRVYDEASGTYGQNFDTFSADKARRSGEANRAFDESLAQFGTNYNTFVGDQARRSAEADRGFDQALGAYNTNYGTFANDNAQRFNQALQGYQTRAGVHNQNEAGRFGAQTSNWTNSFNQGRASENDAWDRQFRVADYGLAAAGGLNSAAGNFGSQGSDIIQNQGNARAAGQVGGANAWGNAIGNIADYGQAIPYMRTAGLI